MRIRYWHLGMYGYKHCTPLHETDPKRKDIRTEHWLCINKCLEMIPEICMQPMELVSGARFDACTLLLLMTLQTTHLNRNTYIAECNAVFSNAVLNCSNLRLSVCLQPVGVFNPGMFFWIIPFKRF